MSYVTLYDVVVFFVLVTFTTPTLARTSGFYADNEIAGQTVLIETLPGSRKRAIKKEILHLLGLNRKPRPSRRGKDNSAPHYMLDLYKTLQAEQDAEDNDIPEMTSKRRRGKKKKGKNAGYYSSHGEPISNHNLTMSELEQSAEDADVIMSFQNQAPRRKDRVRHDGDRHLYFDLTQVALDQQLTGAELRIFKGPSKSTSQFFRTSVFRVDKTSEETNEMSLAFETSTKVTSKYQGWVDVNITSLTWRWAVFPNDNHGLYLKVTDDQGQEIKPKEAGFVGRRGSDDEQPFIVAFFSVSSTPKRRNTRDTRKQRSHDVTYNDAPAQTWDPMAEKFGTGTGRPKCQRRSLFVSFKDLGWSEWIIAPEEYSAFYCHGECSFPLNVHMNATNHAIVQTLVHLMSPSEVPQPSCAPTKLSAISVLFFDDNSNVILKKYRNMVAKSCGCH